MNRLATKLIGIGLVAVGCVSHAFGWGADGHRISGLIAERYLTPKTRAAVQVLLSDVSLAKAGTWADEIRSDKSYDWAKPLHYVNAPRNANGIDMHRDCDNDTCVLGAIERFTNVLRDKNAPAQERVEALKFLVHFVQDVHQPLHVSYEDDRGGNSVKVTYSGKDTNFHKAWDTDLIDTWLGRDDWIARANALADGITPAQAKTWAATTNPIDWANESLTITKRLYADLPPNGQLDRAYYERNIPVIEERLCMAGVRLAALLNSIFDSQAATPVVPSSQPTTAPEPSTEPATTNDATSLVEVLAGETCGNAGGKQMSLVNKHESKAIRVSVEKRWEDQGKPQTSRTTMVIRPGDSAKRTLGCSAAKGQGGVIRSFTWVVVQAEWLE